MARSPDAPELVPAGYFAFRTPLLPIEELEAWNAGLDAPAAEDRERLSAALEADRQRLRSRLRELIARPAIRDALFVASPSLSEGLAAWLEQPDDKKGRRAEEALVRYVQRLMTRATPFGLFSGCSVGTIDSASRLRLEPRDAYQRHTRLDMDYLFALTEDLGRDPHLRRRLLYRPNSSLYLAAGRWRYAEARLQDQRRTHHLVAVDNTEYLETTLEVARDGATMAQLAQALVDDDPDGEVTLEEAEEFVVELIDAQMLVSDLAPMVTGPEPIHDLIDQLADHPEAQPAAQRLRHVRSALAEIDAGGLGEEPESYRAIARRLRELPTEVELPRLFQVDLVKPAAGATLGGEVIAEIDRGIDVLWRLAGPAREDSLSRFRQEFRERYEDGRAVPLVEALDEEIGIGFDRVRGADASPLLEGLAFPPQPGDPTVWWSPWADLLLQKLERALADGADEIELLDEDLKDFDRDRLPPLPDSFQVMARVAAASEESLDRGEFRVFLKSASGPSGAQLLGRFCHADPELRRHVENMLREEERLSPDAVFAEIVHLPEGRIGNILSRPRMREHEIHFLGRGGCDAEHRIPVTDLLIALAGEEVVLRSQRLGRRVLPRLTSAHNYSARSLGAYRFLCTLQAQQLRGGLTWGWGVLERFSFLPRVTCGRLVLSRARWRVERSELDKLLEGDTATRFAALREWRRRRRLPRQALLADGDNELLVDFDNVLSLEAFLALVKERPRFNLEELFPAAGELPASGPEGHFMCEVVVPFFSRREAAARTVAPRPASASRQPVRRTFPPGSEWLYAKLYTGTSTADRLLVDVVGPLARQAMGSGAIDRWFFLRLTDPHWHLRVRFHGEPQRLHAEVLSRLQAAVTPLVDDGRMWRFQLDTYQREVERYGGDDGIGLAERLAHADSEAVLTIIEHLEGDEGAAVRWRLAVRGVDQLIRDLGLEGDEMLRVLERLQQSYAEEFRVDMGFKKQMADRLRQERKELDQLLHASYSEQHPLAPGLAAFDRRSAALEPVTAELRAREAAGRLTVPVADLAASFVHMFNNRLLRSDNRAHEVVLYDFLYRLALSRAARARQRKKA